MSTEIATKPITEEMAVVESQSTQVLKSLTAAVESGSLNPEQLTAILDAQERILDRQAKQDFSIAMANAQAEMPVVFKGEHNKQTNSSFESLDGLNKAISPVYTKHGFSISFGTDESPSEDMIRITAEVTHRGGWSKDYHYDLPYDLAGIKGSVNKTKIHASGSTLTYGRRYLLKLIFNLITSDDTDDDGNTAEPIETLKKDEIANIEALLSEVGTSAEDYLKATAYQNIEDIPRTRYAAAVHTLEMKRDIPQ